MARTRKALRTGSRRPRPRPLNRGRASHGSRYRFSRRARLRRRAALLDAGERHQLDHRSARGHRRNRLEFHLEPKPLHLASDGPFGKFDKRQLQRGFQVYKEVCSACHSLHLVAFRDLRQLGYSEAEVKAIADRWTTAGPVDQSGHRRAGDAQGARRPTISRDRSPTRSPRARRTTTRSRPTCR